MKDWAGPRASLDALKKSKSLGSSGNRTPDRSARSLAHLLRKYITTKYYEESRK